MGFVYRKLFGKVAGRPTNFSWVVAGRLAGCGKPMSRKEAEWLKSQGIDSILSLTESPLPVGIVNGLGFTSLNLPLRNHVAPTVVQITDAVAFIDEEIERGGRVAVHCAAGQGRTGTVLAAYFMKTRRLSVGEAVRTVRRLRPGSIEDRQIGALSNYARNLSR